MRALIATFAIALAACGQTTAPPPAPEPAAETAAAPVAPSAPQGEPMSTGLMGGMSTSAAEDVAGLTVNRDSLAFSNADGDWTFTRPTEFVGVVDPSTRISAGGESFAAAAPSSTATRVEVRRITGGLAETLCSGASYAAIVSAEPLTGLQLMVFTGADAPGPDARDSAVCAIYAYGVD